MLKVQPAALDMRMPSLSEIKAFDPAVAWDRMTPDQQRQLGLTAVEMATIGGLLNFENSYRRPELDVIEERSDAALNRLSTEFEPIWHALFGWADTKIPS
jgi:hypothetical protein